MTGHGRENRNGGARRATESERDCPVPEILCQTKLSARAAQPDVTPQRGRMKKGPRGKASPCSPDSHDA